MQPGRPEPPALSPDGAFVRDHLPAARRKSGLAYAEGVTLCLEALRGEWSPVALLVDVSRLGGQDESALRAAASARRVATIGASTRALEKLTACDTAPPCGVLLRPPAQRHWSFEALPPRLAILDGIADPGNAGTMVRAAVAFGFAVGLTPGSVGLLNEKFLRASAGTVFHEGRVREFPSTPGIGERLASMRPVLVLDAGGSEAIDAAARRIGGGPVAIVLGNETHGPRAEAWPGSQRVRIPMVGNVESLNVAMSGAIALYEFSRTRGA